MVPISNMSRALPQQTATWFQDCPLPDYGQPEGMQLERTTTLTVEKVAPCDEAFESCEVVYSGVHIKRFAAYWKDMSVSYDYDPSHGGALVRISVYFDDQGVSYIITHVDENVSIIKYLFREHLFAVITVDAVPSRTPDIDWVLGVLSMGYSGEEPALAALKRGEDQTTYSEYQARLPDCYDYTSAGTLYRVTYNHRTEAGIVSYYLTPTDSGTRVECVRTGNAVCVSGKLEGRPTHAEIVALVRAAIAPG